MRRFLIYIDDLIGGFFNKIEKTCQRETVGLAYIRIIFGLFFLIVYPPKWQWVGNVPVTFFDPPLLSLANLTKGFPPSSYFTVAEFIATFLLVFITVGFYTRLSSIILSIIFIIASNYVYSFGKIDHSIMLVVTLLCLGFTNSGTQYAVRKDKYLSEKIQTTSLSILGICIAFGMFSAGFRKVLRWIDFDLTTSGFLSWYYPNYYMFDNKYLLAPWVSFIPHFIIELGEYLVVILEVTGFIWLLAGNLTWRIWLFALCIFHLVNHLILNIPFTGHIMVYGVFLLVPVSNSIKEWIDSSKNRIGFFSCTLGLPILIIRLIESFKNREIFESEILSIYGNLALWLLMIMLSFFALRRQ